MKLLQGIKNHILGCIGVLLLIGSAIGIILLWNRNMILTTQNEEYLEIAKNVGRISNENQLLRMRFCQAETYRIARDCRDEFAECAEKARDLPENSVYFALIEMNELNYLHNDFESIFHKNDKYFMNESTVKGGGPYNEYGSVYFRIYYFYDTDAIEKELIDCDYYKETGNNVYFAVDNIGAWDFEPEKLVDTLDSLDLSWQK